MLKFIRKFLFTKTEKEIISDIYAYLSQLEDAWKIQNNDNNEFCLDVALKRKFLTELCPNAFNKDIDKYINEAIWEHVREGRYNKEFNKDITEPMLNKWKTDGIDYSEEINYNGIKIRF